MEQTIVREKYDLKKRKNNHRGRNNTSEINYIILAIEEAKQELEMIRISFNFISDGNLVEALIYRERDIMARYDYLLKKAKEKRIKVSDNYIYNNVCKIY